MPIKRTFIAAKSNVGFTFLDRRSYEDFCRDLKPGDYLMTIQTLYPKRTLPQNSYLHVIFTIIARHTGQDMEDVKDELKRMFALKDHHNIFTGEICQVVQPTSAMDTFDLSQFIDKIKFWALNFLGLYIPDAGDQRTIDEILGN